MDPVLEELRIIREELARLRSEVRALRDKVSSPRAASITVEGTAARLGCCVAKVFDLLKDGKLSRAKKQGKQTMVSLTSIEALEADDAPASLPARPERPAALPRGFDLAEEEAELEKYRRLKLKARDVAKT